MIIGGTSMLAGFHHRLRSELYDLLQKPRYEKHLAIKEFRFHQLPAKQNYAAWLGGRFSLKSLYFSHCHIHYFSLYDGILFGNKCV